MYRLLYLHTLWTKSIQNPGFNNFFYHKNKAVFTRKNALGNCQTEAQQSIFTQIHSNACCRLCAIKTLPANNSTKQAPAQFLEHS
jgi:hypothetical protein